MSARDDILFSSFPILLAFFLITLKKVPMLAIPFGLLFSGTGGTFSIAAYFSFSVYVLPSARLIVSLPRPRVCTVVVDADACRMEEKVPMERLLLKPNDLDVVIFGGGEGC